MIQSCKSLLHRPQIEVFPTIRWHESQNTTTSATTITTTRMETLFEIHMALLSRIGTYRVLFVPVRRWNTLAAPALVFIAIAALISNYPIRCQEPKENKTWDGAIENHHRKEQSHGFIRSLFGGYFLAPPWSPMNQLRNPSFWANVPPNSGLNSHNGSDLFNFNTRISKFLCCWYTIVNLC